MTARILTHEQRAAEMAAENQYAGPQEDAWLTPTFAVLSVERPGWILINAEVATREEALEYQQWAEYVAGEVAWIEVRR